MNTNKMNRIFVFRKSLTQFNQSYRTNNPWLSNHEKTIHDLATMKTKPVTIDKTIALHSRRLDRCLAHTKTQKIPPTSFIKTTKQVPFQILPLTEDAPSLETKRVDQQSIRNKSSMPENAINDHFKAPKEHWTNNGSGSCKTGFIVAFGTTNLIKNKSTLVKIGPTDTQKCIFSTQDGLDYNFIIESRETEHTIGFRMSRRVWNQS